MRTEAFEGSAVERLLVVWVGDADEKLGALLHRFAIEIDCSELCHDVMDV